MQSLTTATPQLMLALYAFAIVAAFLPGLPGGRNRGSIFPVIQADFRNQAEDAYV
jgi:hypothetical protein